MRIDNVNISDNQLSVDDTIDTSVDIKILNVVEESSFPTIGIEIGDTIRMGTNEYKWNGSAWVQVESY